MAFDVSGLSAWVTNNRKEIVTAAVAGAPTMKFLVEQGRVMYGVKNKEAIRMLDAAVNVHAGGECGARNPNTTTTLGEKYIEVTLLSSEENLCPKTLRNTVYAEYLKKGQSPSEEITPELSEAISDVKVAKIAKLNEDLLWQSDTTITGTTNFNLFNGIKKQIGAGTAITATGSTIIEKLQHYYSQIDVTLRKQDDFRIFIGEDDYDEYLIALDNANKFREGSKDVLAGTTAKFQVTTGLNGSGKVYGMRASNLVGGMDGESDAEKAEFIWSVETKQYYHDYAYALGVKVLTGAEAYVASI